MRKKAERGKELLAADRLASAARLIIWDNDLNDVLSRVGICGLSPALVGLRAALDEYYDAVLEGL